MADQSSSAPAYLEGTSYHIVTNIGANVEYHPPYFNRVSKIGIQVEYKELIVANSSQAVYIRGSNYQNTDTKSSVPVYLTADPEPIPERFHKKAYLDSQGYYGLASEHIHDNTDIFDNKLQLSKTYGGNLVPVMTSNTAPKGVVSASNTFSSYAPWRAFNNNTLGRSNYWLGRMGSGILWLQYEYDEPVKMLSYVITSLDESTVSYRSCLRDWTIQGSNDGTTFDTLATVEDGFTAQLRRTSIWFPVEDPGIYKYYRIVITRVHRTDSYGGIAAWEMFGDIYETEGAFSKPILLHQDKMPRLEIEWGEDTPTDTTQIVEIQAQSISTITDESLPSGLAISETSASTLNSSTSFKNHTQLVDLKIDMAVEKVIFYSNTASGNVTLYIKDYHEQTIIHEQTVAISSTGAFTITLDEIIYLEAGAYVFLFEFDNSNVFRHITTLYSGTYWDSLGRKIGGGGSYTVYSSQSLQTLYFGLEGYQYKFALDHYPASISTVIVNSNPTTAYYLDPDDQRNIIFHTPPANSATITATYTAVDDPIEIDWEEQTTDTVVTTPTIGTSLDDTYLWVRISQTTTFPEETPELYSLYFKIIENKSTIAAYTQGTYGDGVDGYSNQAAYMDAIGRPTDSLTAFAAGGEHTKDALWGYLEAEYPPAISNLKAYLEGYQAAQDIEDSLKAYLQGGIVEKSSQIAYLSGAPEAKTSIGAYVSGYSVPVEISAFFDVYAAGKLAASDQQKAYTHGFGTGVVETVPAYVRGTYGEGVGKETKPAYSRGQAHNNSSLLVYTIGGENVQSSLLSYTAGIGMENSNILAYIRGQDNTNDSLACYVYGGEIEFSTLVAFTLGKSSYHSEILCYLLGKIGDHIPVYLEGASESEVEMAQYSYIILRTSDNSLEKKFAVVQGTGYNNGGLEKAETLDRTIGGGTSHSVGGSYRSWNPTLRVKEEETQEGYGDLDDLEYFYNLNNPQGTPSNTITFVDHAGNSHSVHIVGNMEKDILTYNVVGPNSLYFVRVNLIEV